VIYGVCYQVIYLSFTVLLYLLLIIKSIDLGLYIAKSIIEAHKGEI
jgi:signal transduction histidine kinase